MNEIDWEKRARELCYEVFKEHRDSILFNSEAPSWTAQALKLGREMVDARAEEIAARIKWAFEDAESVSGTTSVSLISGLKCAYDIARSFASKKRSREEALEKALLDAVKRLQWHAQKSLENNEITEAAIYKASANEVEQASRKALEWKA